MTTKTSKKGAANVDSAKVEEAVQMLLTAEKARKRTKIDPVLAAAKARVREMKQNEMRARVEARQQRSKMLGKLRKLEEAARHELEAVRKAQAALDAAKERRQKVIEERDEFRKSLPKVTRRAAEATPAPKKAKKPTKTVRAKKVVEKTPVESTTTDATTTESLTQAA